MHTAISQDHGVQEKHVPGLSCIRRCQLLYHWFKHDCCLFLVSRMEELQDKILDLAPYPDRRRTFPGCKPQYGSETKSCTSFVESHIRRLDNNQHSSCWETTMTDDDVCVIRPTLMHMHMPKDIDAFVSMRKGRLCSQAMVVAMVVRRCFWERLFGSVLFFWRAQGRRRRCITRCVLSVRRVYDDDDKLTGSRQFRQNQRKEQMARDTDGRTDFWAHEPRLGALESK